MDLFVNREGHMADVVIEGHLGHSDHDMMGFDCERSKEGGKELLPWTSGGPTLACLGVLWELLKGQGVQEVSFIKKEILKVQKQAIPVCPKIITVN